MTRIGKDQDKQAFFFCNGIQPASLVPINQGP